ncbi:MAG TPA: flavin reductase family protein [Candidatus Saccharimonadales bacterium]|nr:flavin reductase family protein [Candidatus Saccharimonadales bacterium]
MQGSNQEIREKMENVFPEVIGAVITKRGDQVNLCPINYQAISTIYEQPLTICIGLSNAGYTLETILETKEFVYAYPAKDQIHDIIYCGTISGRDGDKLAKTSLEFNHALTVAPPHLAGAVLNYECRLVHSYDAGGKDSFTILIAEIQQIVPTAGKNNLDKIYSLGGHNYGAITSADVIQVGRS